MIRNILFNIECGDGLFKEESDRLKLRSHFEFMVNYGLLFPQWLEMKNGAMWGVPRLTWEGHELLDLIRDDNLWEEVKSITFEATGTYDLAVIREVALYRCGHRAAVLRDEARE